MQKGVTDHEGGGGEGVRGIIQGRLQMGLTDGMRVALAFVVSVALVLAAACSWLPTGPTTTQTVIVSQNQNPTPGPSPSPSTGGDCGGVTSIVLGTEGDQFTAPVTGSIKLVPSFYQHLLELPALCTDTLVPVYTATGTAGCTVSGKDVRAALAGTCDISAKLPAIPPSNAVSLTFTP